MAAQKKTINLLLEDELEKSPLGRFLKWALTTGRYIIVFTELIVIIVFLSRFKLDRDLANLHEEIAQKQTIITASAELENEVRFLQKRLAAINKVQKQSLETSLILKELGEIIPLDVFFSELKIQKNSISLAGISLSNTGIATFLNGLKSSDRFEQLDLKSVSSGGEKDPTLKFQVSVRLSNKNQK